MPAKEIKELRQSGKLEEALELAVFELQQAPENVWTRRNLSWVYYDYAKLNCSPEKFESFCENLKSILELQLSEEEKLIFDNIGWLIIKLGFALSRENNVELQKFNILFDLIKEFHLSKPSEVYSSLFKLFHKVYKNTDKYVVFANWWNFENFRSEDYSVEVLPNGNTIMALVEQAYIAYAKQLLPKQIKPGIFNFDKEKAMLFLSELENIIEIHPEYQYPPYFKAKLLLALGDQDNILSSLLPFAKKKRNDFWVWDILSEAFPSDKEKAFACYCRGLLCSAPEKMIINLRAKIIPLFIEKQMWDEAKTEIEKIIEIRNANNWRIPNKLISYQNEDWYKYANKKRDNKSIYKEFSSIADAILFSDIPEESVIIEFVNSDKKILNFIASETKFGFFKYDRFFKTVHIGDILKVRFLKKESNGLYQIATASKSEDLDFQKKYMKDFKGNIKIKEKKSFGFVDDIFISPSFCEKKSLINEVYIEGKAIKSYNKKKQQWGWRAFKVEKKI